MQRVWSEIDDDWIETGSIATITQTQMQSATNVRVEGLQAGEGAPNADSEVLATLPMCRAGAAERDLRYASGSEDSNARFCISINKDTDSQKWTSLVITF